MKSRAFVYQEELMRATGYERQGDLRKWCERNNLPYLEGKEGRLITTVDAINKAVSRDSDDKEGWEIA